MVLDTARPKNIQSTTWPGMHGRDAARKFTLKVNILHVFTIDFSEIQFIVNHNSQSDGQNNSAKRWTNLHKKTIHIVSFQRKRKDTKDNGISPWTKQAIMCLWNFDQITELQSLSKTVFTASQANKLQNQFLHNNIGYGTLPQAIHGGTRLTGVGGAHNKFVKWSFCYSWFRLQSMAIHCNRRCVDRYTLHVIFLMHITRV